MKKVLLSLLVFSGLITMITSCDNPELAKQIQEQLKLTDVSNVWNHGWFSSDDAEYQFIDDGTTKYVRYLPDSLNDAYYLEVKQIIEESNTVIAVVKYSKDSIREMGTPVTFQMNLTQNGFCITASDSTTQKFKEAFTASNMVTYAGVPANKMDIPAVQTTYFSNMQGTFELTSHPGWELQSSAKMSIKKSNTEYWFAHVVDLQEENGVYDFLLCHDSNTDPGVTGSSGKEPFINSQNTVWSRMKFSPESSNKTKVEWSSQWYAYPYDALNNSLDMSDSINYSIEPIHYKWNFYFGHSEQQGSFWYVADGSTSITTIEETTNTPKNEKWSDVLASIYDTYVKDNIPEGKEIDYWWYASGSFGVNQDSLEYKLTATTDLSLKEYNIYCVLKDKPAAGDVTNIVWYPGEYQAVYNSEVKHTMSLTNTTITIDGSEYTFRTYQKWQEGEKLLEYAFLVEQNSTIYITVLSYYTVDQYYKVRTPIEFNDGTNLPSNYDYSICGSFINNGKTTKVSQFKKITQ